MSETGGASTGSRKRAHGRHDLCGAKTRKGTPCRRKPGPVNTRCYYHGGAPGTGAQPGNRNALSDGHYTREAIARRSSERELVQKLERGCLAVIDRVASVGLELTK